jgi:hypothetical protein
VDGLLLKINDDFFKDLEKRRLSVKSFKIRFLVRDSTRRGNRYRPFPSVNLYREYFKHILLAQNYLCSAGDFPIIENIEIENQNFDFVNSYKWYNITENRYFVKKIQYDSLRQNLYESQVSRYETLMNSLIDSYISTINKSIDVRLNSYMDPCYVDAGYVAPNSDPSDLATLNLIK